MNTSFRFKIHKAAQLPKHDLYHLIGVVEQGTILPPAQANVEGNPELFIHIKSCALSTPSKYKKPSKEVMLVLQKPSFDIKLLEGCTLINAQSLDKANS